MNALPQAFQKPPRSRLCPLSHPSQALPSPIPAPPIQAALRLALGRAGGAAATRWARGQSYDGGVAAGRRCWGACGRGGNAKRSFEFPSMSVFRRCVDIAPMGVAGLFCGVGTSSPYTRFSGAGSNHPSPDALLPRLATRAGRPVGGDPLSPTGSVGRTRKCNGPPPPAPGPRPDAAPPHRFGLFACRPLWEEPRFQEAPQGHEELPRHRSHPHASQALPSSTHALAPPATQGPLRGHAPNARPTPGGIPRPWRVPDLVRPWARARAPLC